MTTPIDHAPITLQAQAGQALHIDLGALPGAGMVWQAPAAPDGCTLEDGGMQAAGAGVGGAAQQRFILTCNTPGERSLQFSYKRPWESEVRARQTVKVSVR